MGMTETTMSKKQIFAEVTKQFEGVPAGKVYPELQKVGAIVEGNLAVAAIENGWGNEVAKAAGAKLKASPKASARADAPPPPPAPLVRATLTKRHTEKGADGKEEVYAKGLVVEGDLAERLVKEGVATLIAPADKNAGAAPATK
jgi:hypothetical protein